MQAPVSMQRNKREIHCFHASEEIPNLRAKAQGKFMPRKAKTGQERKENPNDTMERRSWDGKRKDQRRDLCAGTDRERKDDGDKADPS
mmetsp:Transcript_2017/g.12907  ORF Transcript_2017/g.12907 Transcript_2017/m.12907 type:complete len:88 (-) Transcript_2017:2925-3188(-)